MRAVLRVSTPVLSTGIDSELSLEPLISQVLSSKVVNTSNNGAPTPNTAHDFKNFSSLRAFGIVYTLFFHHIRR